MNPPVWIKKKSKFRRAARLKNGQHSKGFLKKLISLKRKIR